MNIGLDLDGVVYDTEEEYRVEACFYNQKINGEEMIAPDEIKAYKRYNWTKEQEIEFMQSCLLDIEMNAPMKYKAKEVINLLKNDGHKINVVTSRGIVFPSEIEITEKRLQKDNLPIDKTIFSGADKVKACKENNIDIIVEDYYDYVLDLANNGIKVLYFRGATLKTINHPNVTEVRNWGDNYIEIDKIAKILQ